MKCPNCKEKGLTTVMTKNGVLVDVCKTCGGVWLDSGEIYYFTKKPNYLRNQVEQALRNPKQSSRINPHTQKPLVILSILGGRLEIDYCPETGGIWLDKRELEKLPAADKKSLSLEIDDNTYSEAEVKGKREKLSLPNLKLVSGITLFTLYAILTLVLIAIAELGIITPLGALILGIVIVSLQFLLSPFLMDLSLRWFYRMEWVDYEDLPTHLRKFLQDICAKNRMKFPRIGVIHDGSPNAFTYGHTPNNARIVITTGIMDLLEPEEIEAVIAHEIGHAVHWDMLIMTIANLIPLVLYYIYRVLIRIKTDREDKSAPYRYAVAIGAFILYIISEFIVLWLSRVREYFADRFSGANTDPSCLASALVKIGYGLAGKEKKKEERKAELESIKAMGIFDPSSARALAISSYRPSTMGGEIDKENLKGAMKWDLWNPWALYYELQSTHPLIAKRLLALSRQSETMGETPYIRFDERRPESYWDEFLVDLTVASLPFLTMIGSIISFGVTKNILCLKIGAILLGISYLIKVMFSYKFTYFPEMNISSLLKKVKVSGVRPVCCRLEGRIIGRGIPGLIWSEDFILQDSSGVMFLDYRQPLAIWNFLFGLLRAKGYIGKRVKITGWYRRSPVPFVEIKSLETEEGVTKCYTYNVKLAVGIILIFIGIVFLFF